MTRDGRYAEARMFWESYLSLDLAGRERSEALRYASLCRLGAKSEAGPVRSSPPDASSGSRA